MDNDLVEAFLVIANELGKEKSVNPREMRKVR
jgi:hypothetical protein